MEIVAAQSLNSARNFGIQHEKLSPKTTPIKTTPIGNTPPSNALKGVSSSLLERIRAKETAKLKADMMRSPAEEKRLVMIGRLPEIVRIIRTFFVTRKKPALPMEDVIQKVMDSYRSSLGAVEAEAHVKLMNDLLPEWVSLVEVKQGKFLKIDKNRDIAAVISKLQKIQKESK